MCVCVLGSKNVHVIVYWVSGRTGLHTPEKTSCSTHKRLKSEHCISVPLKTKLFISSENLL